MQEPLPLSHYTTQLLSWGRRAFTQSEFIRPDACYYQEHALTPEQEADLGMLLQTLSRTDSSRVHLRCDDWHQTNGLFSSLIATLCFYKYAQNQTKTPLPKLYDIGTVLYNPAKEEARVVAGRHEGGILTRPIKEKAIKVRGEKHIQTKTFRPTFEQAARYIPLANVREHTYTRNALENLTDYFNLFSQTLREYRALTAFPSRLLIVAPHAAVQHLPARSQFPIQYQFNRYYAVPVVEPLVEIVTRYADARQQIRTDDGLDEVVFLGDLAYRDSLNDVLNDLGDGYINRITVLSGQPIPADYGFRCWPWSRTERAVLRTGQQPQLKRITLPADGLKALRPLFVPAVEQLTTLGLLESEARGAINRLVSQHLRDAVVDAPALLTYQRALLNDPESVYRSWFAETGQLADYPGFCLTLMAGLQTLSDHVARNPDKLNQISALVQQHRRNPDTGGHTYVVVRPKQADALNKRLKEHRKAVTAISYRELKTLLKTPKPNKPDQFIFPALHLNYQPGGNLLRDYCLYQRAVERGPGYVLAYEGLEDGLANLCDWLYQRDDHRSLSHPDRQHWVDFHCHSDCPTPLVLSDGGLMAPMPPADLETLDALLDELDAPATSTPGSESPEKPGSSTDTLLKLNDLFTQYFGVWKDVKRSQVKQSVPRPEPQPETGVLENMHSLTDTKKRFLIQFDDGSEYDYKADALLAKVQGGQVLAIRPGQARKGDRIVNFNIRFDTCFDALKTIKLAQDALKEVKWASKTWRDWLRRSIEIVKQSKGCDEAQARRFRYQKLSEIIQVEDPDSEFVQFARFEYWLDKQHEDYIFPRTIQHLELMMASHLNQIIPANRPAKQTEMQRILSARDQSASFREVITKLNQELTHLLLTNRKGAILTNMAPNYVEELLKTRQDQLIRSINPE